eukprot:TRINITY_DN4143_c0_g2_i2.p1 TRINITY_DN4143_c0_g2~~TRINITY_DN4143_c0_g2_i2.p1  ORF type:complete len:435 (-),score=123.94 TRINITY_DN4143_c0_g2_i2:130-1434(-)
MISFARKLHASSQFFCVNQHSTQIQPSIALSNRLDTYTPPQTKFQLGPRTFSDGRNYNLKKLITNTFKSIQNQSKRLINPMSSDSKPTETAEKNPSLIEEFPEELKEAQEKPQTNVNSTASEVADLTAALYRVKLQPTKTEEKKPEFELKDFSLQEIADGIKNGHCKNIIVMSGAGISVAAGIPDFRTPGTGLYDNLKKYQLPFPEAIFEMGYFQKRPEPFYLLAKELYPGTFCPTASHFFIKLLEDKGVLLRNYTQNIDTLERVAGVNPDLLIEAHGSFGTSRCIKCKSEVDKEWLREKIFGDEIPKCQNKSCDGLVKPDIVFFGEDLPKRFFSQAILDFPKCDLLLVMGTSLQVYPFAGLVEKVGSGIPRVLFNNEIVGNFLFGKKGNKRDVDAIGDCQAKIKEFTKLLGWEKELDKLIEEGKEKQKSESKL